MDKTTLIHSLETFVREVHIEKEVEQIATIARVFARYEAPFLVASMPIFKRRIDEFNRSIRESQDDAEAAKLTRRFAADKVPYMITKLKKEIKSRGKTA